MNTPIFRSLWEKRIHKIPMSISPNAFGYSPPLHHTQAGSPTKFVTLWGALTPYTRKIAPKCDFSCISANIVVPLSPIPTLEGNMSCEKRFAMVFLGRFLTY